MTRRLVAYLNTAITIGLLVALVVLTAILTNGGGGWPLAAWAIAVAVVAVANAVAAVSLHRRAD
jgi:hypothetical protein